MTILAEQSPHDRTTRFSLNQFADQWRPDFPALLQNVEGYPLSYLDNAASSQKPAAVIARMSAFMERDYANVHRGLHELSMRASTAYEAARKRVANFLDVPDERSIVFTRGTTEAINLVCQSWGRKNIEPANIILLTEMEHHSNLVPWQQLAKQIGARLAFVPLISDGGALDFEAARRLLAERPKIFAFSHASNVLGVENPARELCALAAHYGVTTLVDAAQTVGHTPVSVREIDCDFLVFSAHKMCGPTGIGALYGRKEILDTIPPWQFGGSMVDQVSFESTTFADVPARFEAGTPAIVESIGLHAAMDYIETVGLKDIACHCNALGELAAETLRGINGVHVLGPLGERNSIVSFVLKGVHSHDVSFFANSRGIALRAGHHCAQPLMKLLGIPSANRASFYFYNSVDEVERLRETIAEAKKFFCV